MSLVSIVVPCFNYGWVLAETLESVVAQTYSNWECIIVDDGSTDNTRAVAEEYQSRDKRFQYIYQSNAGLSAARNTGLAAVKGNYVQLLDADDLLMPYKIELQALYLERHPEIDIIYGDVRYFLHDTPHVFSRSMNMLDQQWVMGATESSDCLLNTLVRGNIMVVNSPLIRIALIRKVGLFNVGLKSMEDWEYWLRCALVGARIHYDNNPDTWAKVRVHSNSMSQNIQRMSVAILQVRILLRKWLQEKGAVSAQKINEAGITDCYTNTGRYQLQKGDVISGVIDFIRVARRSGKYFYYLRSIPYWLQKRLVDHWKKS